MEQTLPPQNPDTAANSGSASTGRNLIFGIGLALVLGLVAIMAINLQNIESVDLYSQQAPDFTMPLFDELFEEDDITLSDLRGQVVVINFWASWCVECYKEAELLEQAWRDYQGQGVVFIGVDHLDTKKEALAYMEKYGITYPSGPDMGDKISQAYAITGVPETFFIDKSGNIAHVQIGPIERGAMYSLLDDLVAKSAEPTEGS